MLHELAGSPPGMGVAAARIAREVTVAGLANMVIGERFCGGEKGWFAWVFAESAGELRDCGAPVPSLIGVRPS